MPDRRRKLKILCLHLFLVVPLLFGIYYFTLAPGAWKGVDEAVVLKMAREHGREAKKPLLEGDLLLFAFLVAGGCGGFAGGYYWRMLVERKGKA